MSNATGLVSIGATSSRSPVYQLASGAESFNLSSILEAVQISGALDFSAAFGVSVSSLGVCRNQCLPPILSSLDLCIKDRVLRAKSLTLFSAMYARTLAYTHGRKCTYTHTHVV